MIFFSDNKKCDYEIEVEREDFDFPEEREEEIYF
jgi:hypothetical protein